MKLISIDKKRYRKHLNRVIVACIAVFVVGSLGISQSLIALFPDESGSHFHWNVLGVVVTGFIITTVLNKYRRHSYMTEVVYVWELKQALNKINRKLMKIKTAAENGNKEAMIVLQYSYSGSRLLWQLDDNTIIMDELTLAQAELDSLAEKYQVELDADAYNPTMLKQF